MRTIHKFSRGVSMVEAMVALAVMAFGMLTIVGVQSTLRLNADIAKQRSEATRIGQEKLDESRAFTVIDSVAPPGRAFADIANDVTSVTGTNATYEVQREVVSTVDPPAKVIRVTVRWADRAANSNEKNQSVVLASTIAAAAPGLSGTLAVRQGTAAGGPVRSPFKRHPTIPVQARDFGTSSAFVLPNHPWLVIVFNNVTGVVTSFCTLDHGSSNDTITPTDIQSCASIVGQLVTGFIRFERSVGGPDLTAADVENPIGPALDLRVHVQLTSDGHPQSPVCYDDMTSVHADNGDKPFVTYFCVVYSNNSLLWSGKSTIEALGGWDIDDDNDPDAHRVCRYTPAASDNQTVPNTDHPRNYSDVSGNLTNQNFVVIAGGKHCPTDVAANPDAGDIVNSNTLQHQPTPH